MNSNAISIAAIIVSLVSILYANHVYNNLQETDDLIKHMVDYDFASAEAIKGLQHIVAGELSCDKGEILTGEELIAR